MHRAGVLARGSDDAFSLISYVHLYGHIRLHIFTFISESDVKEGCVCQSPAWIRIIAVAAPFFAFVQLVDGHEPKLPIFVRISFDFADSHHGTEFQVCFPGIADRDDMLVILKSKYPALGFNGHNAVNGEGFCVKGDSRFTFNVGIQQFCAFTCKMDYLHFRRIEKITQRAAKLDRHLHRRGGLNFIYTFRVHDSDIEESGLANAVHCPG